MDALCIYDKSQKMRAALRLCKAVLIQQLKGSDSRTCNFAHRASIISKTIKSTEIKKKLVVKHNKK